MYTCRPSQRFLWKMFISNKHLNDIYTQQDVRTVELLDDAEEASGRFLLTFTVQKNNRGCPCLHSRGAC